MINQVNLAGQKLTGLIDIINDRLTSYRLVLYTLLAIIGWSVLAAMMGKLPYTWYAILFSTALLVVICRLSGELFARMMNIARNYESDYITALILALIMSPAWSAEGFAVLAGSGIAAIASKYLLTITRRHIFNPAAFGAFAAGVIFHQYASWWVGTSILMPLVLVAGVLIMRKMKRFWMLAIFALVYGFFLHQRFDGAPPLHTIWLAASGTSVLFFGFIMLTEPLTSPDKFRNYLPYSVLVGVLYSLIRLGISPEESLLIGNLLAYVLERGKRLELRFERAQREAAGLYSFAFSFQGAFNYQAGQFMEWTLPLRHSDSRGNRRYLTLSSSPTENLLEFTVRIPRQASHFKRRLATFKPGDKILASHLGGSFTLPKSSDRKLAMVAGGVGITPFRSMAKYSSDADDKRDVSLLYCANDDREFAFRDIFAKAGWTADYINTSKAPLSRELIANSLPDFKERTFYVSGPYGFVHGVERSLLELGVRATHIKTDYFPGYG